MMMGIITPIKKRLNVVLIQEILSSFPLDSDGDGLCDAKESASSTIDDSDDEDGDVAFFISSRYWWCCILLLLLLLFLLIPLLGTNQKVVQLMKKGQSRLTQIHLQSSLKAKGTRKNPFVLASFTVPPGTKLKFVPKRSQLQIFHQVILLEWSIEWSLKMVLDSECLMSKISMIWEKKQQKQQAAEAAAKARGRSRSRGQAQQQGQKQKQGSSSSQAKQKQAAGAEAGAGARSRRQAAGAGAAEAGAGRAEAEAEAEAKRLGGEAAAERIKQM